MPALINGAESFYAAADYRTFWVSPDK